MTEDTVIDNPPQFVPDAAVQLEQPTPIQPLPPLLLLTGAGEDVRVEFAVSLGEALHHPVDLLALSGQPEAPEELPERLHQDQVAEVVQVDEGGQHGDVEVGPFAQVVADGLLVQALALVQEIGDVCGRSGAVAVRAQGRQKMGDRSVATAGTGQCSDSRDSAV